LVGSLVWVPVILAVLLVTPGILMQKKLAKHANEALREKTLRNAILVESIQGIDDIKALQAENRFQSAWNNYNAVSADVELKFKNLTSYLSVWARVVQLSAYALVVLFGAPMAIKGDITMGALIAASILAMRMMSPLSGLSKVLGRLQQAKVAFRSVDALMKLPVD